MRIELSGGVVGEVFYNAPDVEGACPSIYIWVDGNTYERAADGLRYLINMLAAGRECFFRIRPGIEYDKDFDTKIVRWRGVSRFSFVPGEDKWSDVEPHPPIKLSEL